MNLIVGRHPSPYGQINFYQSTNDPSIITADIPGFEKDIPIEIPELAGKERVNFFSTADKILDLLKNKQLYPVFEKDPKRICFKPIADGKIKWEKGPELKFTHGSVRGWICQRNGSLSYRTPSNVMIWDGKETGTISIEILNATTFRAFDQGCRI